MDPLGAAVGFAGLAGDLHNNAWSRRRQQEMWNEQKMFAWHGTQIKAQDMERAGLSKTLAAGQSSQGPSIASIDRPEPGAQIGNALQSMLMKAQIHKTDAETETQEQITANLRERTHGQQVQNDILEVQRSWQSQIQKDEHALRRANVHYQLQQKVNAQLEETLKAILIDQAEVDKALKALALAIQQHDFEIFKDMEVPTTDNSRLNQLLRTYRGLLEKTGKSDPHIQFKSAEQLLEAIKELEKQPERRPLTGEETNKILSGDFEY